LYLACRSPSCRSHLERAAQPITAIGDAGTDNSRPVAPLHPVEIHSDDFADAKPREILVHQRTNSTKTDDANFRVYQMALAPSPNINDCR
jgi:hypothetical protein